MTTVFELESPRSTEITVADLYRRFGPIPLWRIRMDPAPGTATERDMLAVHDHEGRLCELIDGILVEKTVGTEESEIAVWLAVLLSNFVRPRKLGSVLGADGPIRLRLGQIRLPDVCFISRDRLPGGKLPRQPVLAIAPNLAIEVMSRSNTRKEMRRKLSEYFGAGIELVWYVDPRARTVEVFTSPNEGVVLKGNQTLSGGRALPGFKVKVRELFEGLDGE